MLNTLLKFPIFFQELHPDFHNIKLNGERVKILISNSDYLQIFYNLQIFGNTLDELKAGVGFGDLTKEYVPKTKEEESKVELRKQLTKEKLFENLRKDVNEALENHPGDTFLLDLSEDLKRKSSKRFNPKSKLVDLQSVVSQYLEDLKAESEFNEIIVADTFDDEFDDV